MLQALTALKVPGDKTDLLRSRFGIDQSVCAPDSTVTAVATVADPAHTRMALFFDGQIEAIERGAEEQGWVFARQWLPWLDAYDGSEHDINARRKQRRLEREQEAMPGILVFRSEKAARGCLFVMLVPETPTSGVSEPSLIAALNIANLFSRESKNDKAPPRRQIGLLGPSFSGSFPSLTHAVLAWKAENPERLFGIAYGGSRSSRAAREFYKATEITFFSGIQSDLDSVEAFNRVRNNYGIAPEDWRMCWNRRAYTPRTRRLLLRKPVIGRSHVRIPA